MLCGKIDQVFSNKPSGNQNLHVQTKIYENAVCLEFVYIPAWIHDLLNINFGSRFNVYIQG